MSETVPIPRRPWKVYLLTMVLMAVITALVLALILNIAERKREAKESFVKLVEMDEDTIDPEVIALATRAERSASASLKTMGMRVPVCSPREFMFRDGDHPDGP